MLENIVTYLSENKDWMFDGIGVLLIGSLVGVVGYFYKRRQERKTEGDNQTARSAEVVHLNKRGIEAVNQGQYREALNYFNRTLVIRREVGDRAGEGTALTYIGLVYTQQGLYEQALETYNRALVIARMIGNKPMEETILNNIKSLPDD